jgi:putative DNA primase/helicase
MSKIAQIRPAPQGVQINNSDSQSSRLLHMVSGVELFRTPEGKPFARIECSGHLETHSIRSSDFRSYLHLLYFSQHQKAICANAMEEALSVLEARAQFQGSVTPVYQRIGTHGGKLYVDLGTERWEAVEIHPNGKWTIRKRPPVKFLRSRGMLPLPRPVHCDDGADKLRRLLNCKGDEHFHLIVAWLLAAMRPRGPYPVLVFNSEQGTGKTTAARICAGLIDPCEALVRGLPRDERDLLIAASNRWLLAYDNVSHLPEWLLDALCRLSTGGGGGARKLYSDGEEFLFDVQRPVVLNGVTEIVTRADLMDRAIIIDPPQIPETERRTEAEMSREFEEARPAILGWLLDIVAGALSAGDLLTPSKLPRMADFAAWIAAATLFLNWEPGHFQAIYAANRDESHQITLDSSPVGRLFLGLVPRGAKISMSAAELLQKLSRLAKPDERKALDWPKSPTALSAALRRIIVSLHEVGVEVTFSRKPGGNRERIISFAKIE